MLLTGLQQDGREIDTTTDLELSHGHSASQTQRHAYKWRCEPARVDDHPRQCGVFILFHPEPPKEQPIGPQQASPMHAYLLVSRYLYLVCPIMNRNPQADFLMIDIFPHSSLDSLELLLGHSVASRKIPGINLRIYLDARIRRNQLLR